MIEPESESDSLVDRFIILVLLEAFAWGLMRHVLALDVDPATAGIQMPVPAFILVSLIS